MEKINKEHSESSEAESLVKKPKLDLDKVLVEEVGQFGRYQFKALAISLLFVIFLSVASHEYVFTAARVRTRCFIPECENVNDTANKHFVPYWLTYAVPVSDNGVEFDNCRRFAIAYNDTITLSSNNDTCPENIFDKNITVPCEAYIYENMDSAVYDLGLACNEWRRSMIGAARTFGTLFANPLTGFVSDRWGRRTALAINVVNTAWIGLTRYSATSYITFLVTELAESVFLGGIYACVYILLMEMVGPRYRVMVGATCSTFVAVGHVILVSIAWAIPNWRYLTLALYIPQLLMFPIVWRLAESIRWLTSKGQFGKAEKVLKDMAVTNGKELSTKTLATIRESIKSEKSRILEQKDEEKTWLVVLVYRHKPMLLRCLVTPVWWITTTFVYYGLTINSVNLAAGGKFTNYLSVSLSEIPGFWTSCFLVDRLGRKPVLAGSFWLCVLSQIAFVLSPTGYKNLSLVMYLTGKFSISTAMTTLYVYTSELYPTQYRHRLVAFSSMVGRIGSIIAPLTPAFGGNIPFVMFGVLCLLAGLLVMVTPETLGCKLPDTMEEASDLGKTQRS